MLITYAIELVRIKNGGCLFDRNVPGRSYDMKAWQLHQPSGNERLNESKIREKSVEVAISCTPG